MAAPVFFDETCRAAIAGKAPDEAIATLGNLILEASMAKEAGYGPPLDDLNRARRTYLALIEHHYGRALVRAERAGR